MNLALDNYRNAVIDATGVYRYWLRRGWGTGAGYVVWVMCNPSTADGMKDDPTIRRCIEISKKLTYGGMEVVNLYAYRSSKPSAVVNAMIKGKDVIGPDNNQYILNSCREASAVIFAWGDNFIELQRTNAVISQIQALPKPVPLMCLGYTKRLQPRHPLWVRDPHLQPFERDWRKRK